MGFPGFNIDELLTGGARLGVLSAPAFIIQQHPVGKGIILKGRYLPYRGVGFGRTMRTKQTWYPGNPAATQQILGPEIGNTTIEGTWKDRFVIGNVEMVGFELLTERQPDAAQDVILGMQQILNEGKELRVSWGPINRRGILVEFTPTYLRKNDIEWTAEFEWHQDADLGIVAASTDISPSKELGSALNQLNDRIAFASDVLDRFQNQVIANVRFVEQQTNVIFNAARLVNDGLSTPAAIIGAVASSAEAIRSNAQEEAARLLNVPYATTSAVRRLADLLSTEAYRRDVARDTITVQQKALAVEREFADSSRANESLTDARGGSSNPSTRNSTKRIEVPENTSLYTISSREYGTPDLAGFLADTNSLDSFLVPGGTQILVPPRPTTEDC